MKATTRLGALLLLSALVGSAWPAQGPVENVAVLAWVVGRAEDHPAFPVELSPDAPEGCERPDGAKSPLYLSQAIADGRTLLLAAEWAETDGRLWVDLDLDGALGEEPVPLILENGRLTAEVTLALPVDGVPDVEIPLRFERPLKAPPATLEVRVLAHLEGELEMEGRMRRVVAHDRNADLQIDDVEADIVLLDVVGDGRLERVVPGVPFRVRHRGYVPAVSGRMVDFRFADETPPPRPRPWPARPVPPAGVDAPGPEMPRKVMRERYAKAKHRDELLRTGTKERGPIIREIGRSGTKSAFSFLLGLEKTEEAAAVKVAAVRAMGYRQYAGSAGKLLAVARSSSLPEVRVAAISALHAMDAPGREKDFLKLFAKDADPGVGKAAARHLAFLETEKARRALEEAVSEHSRPERRVVAYVAATRYRASPPAPELVLAAAAQPGVRLRALALGDAHLLRLVEARRLALELAPGAAGNADLVAIVATVLATESDAEAVAALLPLAASESPSLRAKLVRLLAPIRGHASVAVLVSWLSAEAPPARSLAAQVVAEMPNASVTGALGGRLAKESVEEVVLALVTAAGRRGDGRLAEPVVSAAERFATSARVRLAALEALARMGFDLPVVASHFEKCAKIEEFAERAAVFDIAGASGDPGAAPLLVGGLGDPVWQVRLMCAEGLGRIRVKESIGPLVKRLQTEPAERVRRAIGAALHRITGLDMLGDPDLWRRWFEEKGEEFEVPEEPPKRDPEDEAGKTVARFYGIPVRSNRVVFVIDQSGSMGATGGLRNDLDRAVEEALEVLDKLESNARVNVILFEDEPHPYSEELVLLTPRASAAIRAHLLAQKPKGGTNLYDALERALLTPGVDTVYLLSDGDPSRGKHVRAAAILAAVSRINQTRRVEIHCVALGFGSPLLRKLAEQNGGSYVER